MMLAPGVPSQGILRHGKKIVRRCNPTVLLGHVCCSHTVPTPEHGEITITALMRPKFHSKPPAGLCLVGVESRRGFLFPVERTTCSPDLPPFLSFRRDKAVCSVRSASWPPCGMQRQGVSGSGLGFGSSAHLSFPRPLSICVRVSRRHTGGSAGDDRPGSS